MTKLEKIKLIDFYLHGVDRDISCVEDVFFYRGNNWHLKLEYHTSLDALRPVIVKLNQDFKGSVFDNKVHRMLYNIEYYLIGQHEFSQVFDSVVECITYLNEKEK